MQPKASSSPGEARNETSAPFRKTADRRQIGQLGAGRLGQAVDVHARGQTGVVAITPAAVGT
jgi:hypothetical protein